MPTLTIPPESWKARLNRLSDAFEGWLVSLDVTPSAAGRLREFRRMPLLGITAESNGPIVISVAEPTGEHVSHIIRSPKHVRLEQTDRGANAALEIESADGEKAVLRFRSTEVDH